MEVHTECRWGNLLRLNFCRHKSLSGHHLAISQGCSTCSGVRFPTQDAQASCSSPTNRKNTLVGVFSICGRWGLCQEHFCAPSLQKFLGPAHTTHPTEWVPAFAFDSPIAIQNQKIPKYTLRDLRFCGRWGNRTSDLYNVNVTL